MAKYAGHDFDFDQKMHMDYGNNTFVVPVGNRFEQLASITYLTDVTIEMGPTRVVSYVDGAPWSHATHWTREAAPELFAAERAVTVPAGSIFLYSMRTFHRGSAMTASSGVRHSLHVAYQHRSMTWGGWRNYVRTAPRPDMATLITQLSPDRRSMVGFPPIGDPYWTPESIDAVQRRYPEMDLTPYR
jgi:ectoine hydroxylase-related dioxygenase (phytanoyl-CoA dioxygenase family)